MRGAHSTIAAFALLIGSIPLAVFPDAAHANHAPSCAEAIGTPTGLWPPNHRFSPVQIAGVTDPDGDPVEIQVLCVMQDEPLNATGDGNTDYDAKGTGASSTLLRSERSGNGDGRVYHIDFSATDVHGASCTGEVLVGVPHSAKKRAVDGGRLYLAVQDPIRCGAAPPPSGMISAPADKVVEATGPTTTVDIGLAQATGPDGTALVTTADNYGPYPLGTTVVTWRATDVSGATLSATQSITVQDTTPPAITVFGSNPASMYCEFGVYVDEGVAARDLVDGDLTSRIAYKTIGTAFNPPFQVSYTVQDSSGNQASASRTLNAPCDSELLLNAPLFETSAGDYPDYEIALEATGPLTATNSVEAPVAFDRHGNPLDVVATFDPSGWNTVIYTPVPLPDALPVGEHHLVWQAVDGEGIVGQLLQILRVADTLPPIMTLNGLAAMVVDVNAAFSDPGVSAHDVMDGDLTSAVTRLGVVNTAVPGVYTLTYRVADSSGNGSQVIRTVSVVSSDVQPPVVAAPPSITVEATGILTPVPLGTASAIDLVDGPVTATPDKLGPFPLGRTQVTWTARDVAGNVGSAVQIVTVLDTTAPAITAPGDIDTYAAGPTALFIGQATATDNVGATVSHDAPAVFPLGKTLVTWTATDPSGNSATAVQTITLTLNLPPVALAGENQTVYQGSVVRLDGSKSSDPDGHITSYEWAEGFTVLSNAATFSKSDFALGRHDLTLTVIDNHDGWDSASVTVDVKSPTPNIPLALSYDPPIDGIQVSGNWLQVSGTFQAAPNAGITVNGHVAALEGNRFYARVPLSAGQNTLTTILTAQDGQNLTLAPTVTSDGIAPDLEITAEELEGIESLTVTFTMTNRGATPLLVSAPGLWTSNVNLAPGTSLTWQPTRAPGVWPIRFVATDMNGLQTEQTFTIVVHERYAMDQAFKLLWSGFTAALTTGERERAMTFLTAGAQAKYGPVFDALAADLPQIFASFSSLQLSEISPEMSEYGVVRDKNGVSYLYLIYFIRDNRGIWRLDSM